MQEIDTGSEELLCRLEGRVATLVLNRPESRNAITLGMKQALARMLARLGEDERVGCLLLTGAGRAFCAGGDTRKMAAEGVLPDPAERLALLRWEHRIPLALHRLPKPVLAVLPGPAAGAGLALALACDLRIAAESAFVTTSYVKLGLSGDYGGTWFLTRLVGTARARELYFLGERLDARDCERLGLVNRVVPDAELEGQALDWARRLSEGAPVALRYMKQNLNRALGAGLEALLDEEAERMVASAQTADYAEAVAAFREKRPPRFQGR